MFLCRQTRKINPAKLTAFTVLHNFDITMNTIIYNNAITSVVLTHAKLLYTVVIFAVVLSLANFARQSSRKCPLQYMAIYSYENITKIAKSRHREYPHLVQNHENICTQNIWRIWYLLVSPVMIMLQSSSEQTQVTGEPCLLVSGLRILITSP